MPVLAKIYNILYGAIVADMIGYVTCNITKDIWPDNSSMKVCLSDSINLQKNLDYEDIIKLFLLSVF